jgi:hypothetical protein
LDISKHIIVASLKIADLLGNPSDRVLAELRHQETIFEKNVGRFGSYEALDPRLYAYVARHTMSIEQIARVLSER